MYSQFMMHGQKNIKFLGHIRLRVLHTDNFTFAWYARKRRTCFV